MVRRNLVVLFVVAALVLVALAPAPVAAAEWCDTDPLVLVVTPAGTVVPVYVLVGALGVEHLPAAQAASIVSTTVAVDATAGGRATKVALMVLVPDDVFASGFPTRSAASSGPLGSGTIYDATSGISGQTMTLRFTLAVP
jgi:hypothetical protein